MGGGSALRDCTTDAHSDLCNAATGPGRLPDEALVGRLLCCCGDPQILIPLQGLATIAWASGLGSCFKPESRLGRLGFSVSTASALQVKDNDRRRKAKDPTGAALKGLGGGRAEYRPSKEALPGKEKPGEASPGMENDMERPMRPCFNGTPDPFGLNFSPCPTYITSVGRALA
eukprot:jgi/Botrbrau1/13151/Bobra.0187s0099.1